MFDYMQVHLKVFAECGFKPHELFDIKIKYFLTKRAGKGEEANLKLHVDSLKKII